VDIGVATHTARQIADAARLLGAKESARPLVVSATVGDLVPLYDVLVTHDGLREVSRQLFVDGHYARAVEEAYKFFNNEVKRRAGSKKDGPDLMHHVFNEDRPIMKLNALRSTSERDEQAGYRFIFAGAMAGVRNPRAHEHDLRDQPEAALELLVMANHLLRAVGKAKRARRRRTGS